MTETLIRPAHTRRGLLEAHAAELLAINNVVLDFGYRGTNLDYVVEEGLLIVDEETRVEFSLPERRQNEV